ncbi:beta-lactamase-like protein [Mycena rosella]|uniref:Beta-lactamase-like protein n=1 Tax=Mycena rosella TaxID=1033263 RepID=A0AAD7DP73_MYCRO|nr:beta-lactamase-like protein [Mycena rosella]
MDARTLIPLSPVYYLNTRTILESLRLGVLSSKMLLLPSLSLISLFGGTYASFRDFGIPVSNATVDVRVFNVGNATLRDTAHAFISPVLPGNEAFEAPLFAFLVEHNATQTRIMFDLGIRKDPLNFVPSIANLFSSGLASADVSKDITDLLQDGGIPLTSIKTVIWSHSHFDHIGDMSKFPNTTTLAIGPGTNTAIFPGSPNGILQASDFAGHNVTELNFSTTNLSFNSLKAIDYFGDGSFYLLNTPGHLPGHISALARVTPTSFISLGGDTFHHAGEARPRPEFQKNFPCPAHLLEETKTSISTDYFWSPKSRDGAFDMPSRAQQLLAISDLPDSFYADPVTSQVSLEKLATLDADPDIFVIVAHDRSLLSSLPYFPASLSGWKASQLKERTVWNFADKTNPAFIFSPTNKTT